VERGLVQVEEEPPLLGSCGGAGENPPSLRSFGEASEGGLQGVGPHPLYRVLQCYTHWPAYTKWRSRVLHRVLQSATQGATFSFLNFDFRFSIRGKGTNLTEGEGRNPRITNYGNRQEDGGKKMEPRMTRNTRMTNGFLGAERS
jgi:hypothetical protein